MAAVRRIIVGVHGSLGSLQALRLAADEAVERQVPLVLPWSLRGRRVLVPDLDDPEFPER